MKPWGYFKQHHPELAMIVRRILFHTDPIVGYGFLATLRRDGAPRLHPVSIVLSNDHLYTLIPPASPKCADLLRDGRYALPAFPPPNNEKWEEFYLTGVAVSITDPKVRQVLINETQIKTNESEVLFELFFDRAMYTHLEDTGTPREHAIHQKWSA